MSSPPGHFLLRAPVLTATHGAEELTGLLVHPDGRVVICHRGEGLGVEMHPVELVQFGELLAEIGRRTLAEGGTAAQAAADELDIITQQAAGNA